jgi:hypothetical protein
MVQVADCQSVFLYDPFQKVVANVHSGWRGSIKNVIGRAVKTLLPVLARPWGPAVLNSLIIKQRSPKNFGNIRINPISLISGP